MNFIDRLNEEIDEQESPDMSEIMDVLNSIKTQQNDQNDIERSLVNMRKYHDTLIESCGKMYETLRGKLSAKQIKEIIETFLGCIAH